MLIYTGYAAVMRGEEIADPAALLAGDSQVEEDIHDLSGDLPYAYCTEYDIVNFREDCTEGDVDSFRRRLNRIGNCVKVTGDLTETKVHVHTNDPGNAIQYGIELGELVNVKLDNMLARKRALEAEKAPAAVEAPAEPAKEFGMVAVSLGDGFSSIFRDLTVDVVVEGGQTMNPSVDDILNAINQVNAKCVFVFPEQRQRHFRGEIRRRNWRRRKCTSSPRRTWRWALPRRSRSKTTCPARRTPSAWRKRRSMSRPVR